MHGEANVGKSRLFAFLWLLDYRLRARPSGQNAALAQKVDRLEKDGLRYRDGAIKPLGQAFGRNIEYPRQGADPAGLFAGSMKRAHVKMRLRLDLRAMVAKRNGPWHGHTARAARKDCAGERSPRALPRCRASVYTDGVNCPTVEPGNILHTRAA